MKLCALCWLNLGQQENHITLNCHFGIYKLMVSGSLMLTQQPFLIAKTATIQMIYTVEMAGVRFEVLS